MSESHLDPIKEAPENLEETARLHEILRKNFGFESFRKGQLGIIQSILSGRDTMAVMPTGGGKSLCYQVPALFADQGIVVVICPLIALMRDQVQALRKLSIPAGALHSGQEMEEKRAVFSEMNRSRNFVLYVSPERVQNQGFAPWLEKQKNISLFAIDEAHCISQWGSDFRQDYYRLDLLRKIRPNVPILALTATATPPVLRDIEEQLSLKDPARHVHGFYRPNLYYQVEYCDDDDDKGDWIRQALRQFPDERVLIYCGTRKKTVQLVSALKAEFPAIDYYHAGRNASMRSKIQKKFEDEEIKILVATNAFGMGIDYPDIRLVIHRDMPANIESLYQEMGRAGRDGLYSTCLMLYSKKDRGLQAYFIQSSDAPDKIIQSKWRALKTITQFSEVEECRHSGVLSYFRDPARMQRCGHCDVCRPDSERKIQEPKELGSFGSGQPPSKRKKSRKGQIKKVLDTQPFTPEQEELYKHLKDWRREFAAKNDRPAFMIFSNKTLEDLVRKRPSSLVELHQVHGFGSHKVELLGSELLKEIQKAL